MRAALLPLLNAAAPPPHKPASLAKGQPFGPGREGHVSRTHASLDADDLQRLMHGGLSTAALVSHFMRRRIHAMSYEE